MHPFSSINLKSIKSPRIIDSLSPKPQLHQQNQQNCMQCDVYDICHHCRRVIPNGSLIGHLKNQCLPRRKRMLQLKSNLTPETKFARLQTKTESPKNTNHMYRNAIQQFRHKVYSPWTSSLQKQIRDVIVPTRSILIQKNE